MQFNTNLIRAHQAGQLSVCKIPQNPPTYFQSTQNPDRSWRFLIESATFGLSTNPNTHTHPRKSRQQHWQQQLHKFH